ncbi:MAG: hypothetical protein ILP11_03920 [Alphaproteobacteria bacterium]|nr:hypothetical protein [Alphaproteobacteria bacterium]
MISDFSDCVYCPVKNYTDRHYIDYVWGSIFYDRTKKECTCSVPGLKWSEENKICQATCEGDANGYPLLFNDDFAALRWSNETTIDTDALRDSKLLKSKFERTQLCVVCNKDEDCGDYKSCYSIDAADGTTTDWRYPNDQEWTSIVNEKTILINGVKTKIIQVPDSWLTKTTYDDIKESFCDWWNSPLMAPGFKGGKTCDEKFAEYRSEVLKPNVLVVGKEFAGEFDQGVRFKLCGSKQECGANQFKYVEYFTGSAKIAVELRISCRDLSMPSTLTCTRTSAAEDTCFKGGPGYAGVFSNLTGYEEYIGCVDPANGLCGCFGTATLSGLTPVAGTYKVNDTPVKGTPKCTCNSGEYLPDWGSYNTNLCSNQSFGNGHFTCPGQTAEEYFKNKHIVTMCRNLENFQSYTFYYYDNVRDDAGNPTCEQGHTLEGCFKAKKPATLYTSKNFRKGIALVAAPTATVADNIAAANVCGAVLNGMMLTSADQYTSGIDTLDAYCNIKKATKRALKTFVKDDTGNKWNQYSDKHVAQEVCLPSNPKDAEPKDIVKACEKETGAIVPLCVTTVYNGCCADAGDDDDSTDNTCANTLCNPNDIFLKGIQYIRGPSSTCRVMSRCFNELKRSFIDGCANGTNKTGAKACLKDKLKQLKACSTNWNKCKDIKLDDCASSCYQQTVKPALFDQWYSNGPSCDTGASGEGVNIVDKFDKARYDCGATPEICDDAWKEVSDLVAKYIAGSEVYDDGK